jgi:leucyl/phenylalanyl-tRNA--protein transferase
MAKSPDIPPELRPRALLNAYACGAFPMPDPDDEREILWFSPDRRGLLPLDERFHVSRRLAATIRQGRFACTIDRAFSRVMRACAAKRADGTWITRDFMAAYRRLHQLGYAHSVEAWVEPGGGGAADKSNDALRQAERPDATEPARRATKTYSAQAGSNGRKVLAGGLYGVSIGGAFFAESMFHRVTDAGKVALVFLVEHLRKQGFVLCDVQWTTPNLERFGAFEMPREEYLSLLAEAIAARGTFAGPAVSR